MRGQHGGDLWKRTRYVCLPEFKGMVGGGAGSLGRTYHRWLWIPGGMKFRIAILLAFPHLIIWSCVITTNTRASCIHVSSLVSHTVPVNLLVIGLLTPPTSQLPGLWNVFFVVQSFLHIQFWNWPHWNILYCSISFQKQTYIISLFTQLGQHPSMQWPK